MNFIERAMAKNLQKLKTPEELLILASSGNSTVARAAAGAIQNTLDSGQKMQAAIQATGPSDSEVLSVINNQIAMPALQAPLTSAMQQQYLSQYKSYIGQGMTPDQAFDQIAAEFVDAAERGDTAFYESRTGVSLSNGNGGNVDPALLPYVQKTGGASGGNNNMLIYGGIALVGLYLLFGNRGKGLSGAPSKENTKSRKPAKKALTKGKGSPATKSKKSGRMQVVHL